MFMYSFLVLWEQVKSTIDRLRIIVIVVDVNITICTCMAQNPPLRLFYVSEAEYLWATLRTLIG